MAIKKAETTNPYEKPALSRSAIMATVKSKDTKPERLVRRALHTRGLRYRLNDPRLPGKPDLVFPRWRTALFVDGCFWHGHDCKRGARTPKTNADYWRAKIARNVARDERVFAELAAEGWRVIRVWECELRAIDFDALARAVRDGETSLTRAGEASAL